MGTSLLLALTLILGSCSKDFLNTRPVGRVLEVNYYQTEEQAFEALVSIYDVLQWNDQYGFTMFRFLQNVASDDTYAGGSDASDQPSWVAYDNFTLTPNLGPQRGFWRKSYKGIYRANLFLEKIDGIEDASEAFRTRTKGEAKFLEIDLNLSEQALELLPVDMPEIKISGYAPAKIFLKFQESNKVEFELTSDLKGVELWQPTKKEQELCSRLFLSINSKIKILEKTEKEAEKLVKQTKKAKKSHCYLKICYVILLLTNVLLELSMRLYMNELQKEYCVKIKLIALD